MKIRFQNEEWLFVPDGSGLADGGAIATDQAFASGRASYAHLFPSGKILRFLEEIGTVDDIEIIDENYEVEPSPDAFLNILAHPSWDGPENEVV